MVRLFFLIFLLAFLGCGDKREDKKPNKPNPPTLLQKLNSKYDLYREASAGHRDSHNWISNIKCDGLLFNSLWSIAGISVDIMQARDETGRWFRHASRECFDLGQSGSSISRDMLIGLLHWIWVNERLDVIDDLIAYGEDNNWIMGEGDPTRIDVRPGLMATFYELRFQLGGENSYKRRIPQAWQKPTPFFLAVMEKGYRTHIHILHIFLRALITNNVNERELEILKYYHEREPLNALYFAVYKRFSDGDMTGPIELLVDDTYFPNDRLPTSAEYCTDYPFQRDQYKWRSCPEEKKVHSAVGWLYSYVVITSNFRRSE